MFVKLGDELINLDLVTVIDLQPTSATGSVHFHFLGERLPHSITRDRAAALRKAIANGLEWGIESGQSDPMLTNVLDLMPGGEPDEPANGRPVRRGDDVTPYVAGEALDAALARRD